jgi:hypothetical protein
MKIVKYRIVQLSDNSLAIQARPFFLPFWMDLAPDGQRYQIETLEEGRKLIDAWNGKGQEVMRIVEQH